MPQTQLTGSRIRARRLDRGLRQSELAAEAGISASYLNLIEHNRRSIGGSLLNTLARALGTEAAALAEGAEGTLLSALASAAVAEAAAAAETERLEDFAGRFPGWAGVVAAQGRRVERLEREAAAMVDRLSHDPALAASLHEVISTVTSIRATSSILAAGAVDADWQERFHRNIDADARRLAEVSRALVDYLETPDDIEVARGGTGAGLDALEQALDAVGQHLPSLEAGGSVDAAVAALGVGPSARPLAARWLAHYREDAQALPLDAFSIAARASDYDPQRLSVETGAPAARILRRLATLPAGSGQPEFGFASCDASGSFTRARLVPGLVLPRADGCPLWPLHQALGQPGRAMSRVVEVQGGSGLRLLCHAVAEPVAPTGFDAPAVLESVMLVRPATSGTGESTPVGLGCHICPRADCAQRRAPSVRWRT